MQNEYLPWQQRVIEEKVELEAKLDALQDFLDTRGDELPFIQYNLLCKQLNAMADYLDILCKRIKAFG